MGRIAHTHGRLRSKQRNWRMLALLPLWVFVAFMASQFIVVGILYALRALHVSPEQYVSDAVAQTIIAAVVYAMAIAMVIGAPYVWRRYKTSLEDLGLARLPSWGDIGLSPLAFMIYALLVSLVMVAVDHIPGFPADQAQDIGFSAFGSRLDNVLAFITLVVLAPIAEETLFRGYLYGKLKKYVPVVVAAIATSLLFGFVHGQLNVGVDVFVLSLILCGLRSLTGSIWAGVLVHMIKNAIAYYLLFISPILGG